VRRGVKRKRRNKHIICGNVHSALTSIVWGRYNGKKRLKTNKGARRQAPTLGLPTTLVVNLPRTT